MVHDYSRGFWVGFAFAVAGVAATVAMIRERDLATVAGEEPARVVA